MDRACLLQIIILLASFFNNRLFLQATKTGNGSNDLKMCHCLLSAVLQACLTLFLLTQRSLEEVYQVQSWE